MVSPKRWKKKGMKQALPAPDLGKVFPQQDKFASADSHRAQNIRGTRRKSAKG